LFRIQLEAIVSQEFDCRFWPVRETCEPSDAPAARLYVRVGGNACGRDSTCEPSDAPAARLYFTFLHKICQYIVLMSQPAQQTFLGCPEQPDGKTQNQIDQSLYYNFLVTRKAVICKGQGAEGVKAVLTNKFLWFLRAAPTGKRGLRQIPLEASPTTGRQPAHLPG
jgi:hypothetical protein